MKKAIANLMTASFLMLTSMASSGDGNVNFRVSPALLGGMLHTRADIKVNSNFSIGPMLDHSMWILKYSAIGVGANIKLDDDGDIMKTSGWYANPYATYAYGRFDNEKDIDSELLPKVYNKTAGLILGYQWVADSGFNFRLGLGGQYNSVEILGRHVWPDVGMTFGYVF